MNNLLSKLDELELVVRDKHLPGRHNQKRHDPHKVPGIKPSLQQLARIAQQFDSFEDFEGEWMRGLHGQFWHLTSDPNFEINPKYSPREASSMAVMQSQEPGLMVTEDVAGWDATLNPEIGPRTREYAAEIDLSDLEYGKDYSITSRGFGHEIYVFTPEKAKVKRVIPIDKAVRINHRFFDEVLPQSRPALQELYNKAQAHKNG